MSLKNLQQVKDNLFTIDDGSVVRVTEDIDDGAVRVDMKVEKNVLVMTSATQYKKPLPDEGDPKPAAEFTDQNQVFGRRYGPDDLK